MQADPVAHRSQSRLVGGRNCRQAAMGSPTKPRAGAPPAPHWREEIFQLVFWMQGEGFGDHLDADLLERALGAETSHGLCQLEHLVDENLLCRDENGRYQLTAAGRWYGQRVISGEADL